MAILPSLPGISVTVHNAKGQLPEYADAEPDVVKNLRSPSSVVVSNYIEAPPDGGPFWPKYRVDAPYTHGPHRIYFMVNIPGVDIRRGMSCGPSDVKEERSWENVLEGYDDIDERGPVYRNFQFTKLKILSDDGQSDGLSEKQNSQVAGIGTLQVRVLLGERGKMFEPGKHGKPTIPILTEKIAEKKCLSLAVGYTDKLHNTQQLINNVKYIDGFHNPIAVFQFKYRSRADLQRLLLIEKSPEPEQLPREDLMPTLLTPPVPSSAPSLSLAPKAFEELTFAEVRGFARKQYKSFDTLSGDEMEKLAMQRHVEEMARANREGAPSSSSVSHTSGAFEDLTFRAVRDLARKEYKSFNELNGDEIEGLARQGHFQELASLQPVISGASDERNGQGKRKVPIKVEDADEDVVFVLAKKTKK